MYISACSEIRNAIYSAIGSWLCWSRQNLSQDRVIDRLVYYFDNNSNSDWLLIDKNRDKLIELYHKACTQFDAAHPIQLRANPPTDGSTKLDYSLIDWKQNKS